MLTAVSNPVYGTISNILALAESAYFINKQFT